MVKEIRASSGTNSTRVMRDGVSFLACTICRKEYKTSGSIANHFRIKHMPNLIIHRAEALANKESKKHHKFIAHYNLPYQHRNITVEMQHHINTLFEEKPEKVPLVIAQPDSNELRSIVRKSLRRTLAKTNTKIFVSHAIKASLR